MNIKNLVTCLFKELRLFFIVCKLFDEYNSMSRIKIMNLSEFVVSNEKMLNYKYNDVINLLED